MQLVDGATVDSFDAFAIERVTKVLGYCTTLRGNVPGLLSEDLAEGSSSRTSQIWSWNLDGTGM